MLKYLYQISIIFILNVNCGIIKREILLNKNQTTSSTTNLSLINLIENVTIPNTTPTPFTTEITTNLDINFMELHTTLPTTTTTDSIIINYENNNNTFPKNVNSKKEEEQIEKISSNENYIKTTTKLDNLKLNNQYINTTTAKSQLEELLTTTIFNDNEKITTKNNEQGNILMKSDYTTVPENKNLGNLFSTTNSLEEDDTTTTVTIQTTTTDKPVILNENLNNHTINNNSTYLNQLKLQNISNSIISTTTELYNNNNNNNNNLSTTTLKSIDNNHHQLKLNKNYDIVTNEIANLTIPNTTGNIKLAKFFKENSTSSKDLIYIDNNNGIIKKNIKDKEKLNVNITNDDYIKEILVENIDKNLNNSSLILHPKSSSTPNPINFSTTTTTPTTTTTEDTIVTLIKTKENELPLQKQNNLNNSSDVNSGGDVNSVEQNNLMKIKENKIINSSSSISTVNNNHNNNNYKDSLNNIKNSLNDIKTVRFSSIESDITSDKPKISTITEPIIIHNNNNKTLTTSTTNENLFNIENNTITENYQNTNIYVTKNYNNNNNITRKQPNFTKNYLNNFSMLTTTELTDTTTPTMENVTDLFTTSTETDDQLLTTEIYKNNNNNNVENFNSTLSYFPTFTDILTTSTLSYPFLTDNNNLTTTTDDTTNIEFKSTTPINEELFSSTVPESSIEINFIEKTEKSIIDLNTTSYHNYNNLSITTVVAPTKMDNIKQQEDNDTIINLFTSTTTTTISPKTENESTSLDNIIKINDRSAVATTTSKIMTAIEENLNKNQSLDNDGMERSSNDPDYNVIIAISVSVIGIVALILLVGFLYVMRKRQKQLTYGQRCRPVSLDAYSLDNVSIYNSVRRKAALRASKRSYGNAAFDDPALIHNNMSIIELNKFIERKSAINEEFKNIPQIIARTDEVPQGCEEKNRYANVIPLPETRVILQQIDNDEKTEYINANFVRGPKDSPNYYIACQAPLESTVLDFWRMIWEQNTRVIVMATDLIENGIEKCAEYLPASLTLDNHVIFGDFQITLKNREVKEKYAVSILHLKNNIQTNLSREITHFWYQWPETGVPTDYAGVIAMLLEARSSLKISNNIDKETDKETKTENDEKIINTELNGNIENNKGLIKTQQGPLVIHCSPGTGRTGTITTIDIALRSLETTKRVDIPQIVYYVRRGRASSVQTIEQYEFIYKVVNVYAAKITGSTNDN